MTQAPPPSSVPWYRHRWPWLIMAPPAVSVVLGMILLYFAITTADGLVVDDYYRQGRAIDQTIARSVHASELGLAADVHLQAGRMQVDLQANDNASLPREIVVTIAHPTRAGFDQVVAIEGHDGVYTAPIAPLMTGRWQIQIEDVGKEWRLSGSTWLPNDNRLRILPYEPED